MNIRKFIGATSREALRLVREALGADAVVLSNRTLDDGSVEIVALADSDLAAIAKTDGAAAANGAAPAPKTPRTVAPAVGSTPAPVPNPYASGMPDVFSSVFGASPEVGADGSPASAGLDADTFADAQISLARDAAPIPRPALRLQDDAAQNNPAARRAPAAPTAALSQQPQQDPADALAAAAMKPFTDTPVPPLTMAESNPWLLDHARRIAGKEATRAGITPSDAMAKGLGSTADPRDEPADGAAPDWAREAAQLAARRAAQRLGQSLEGDEPGANVNPGAQPAQSTQSAAASVGEAVRARIEQVVNETVMNELAAMRGMMEEQFAGLLWGERQRRSPIHGALTKQLFAAGFSAQLVKMVIDRLPECETAEAGMEWIQSVLESNLPVLENEEALMERGGVFALMGPTGVGKTTTTAKLAARCVMRFGASRVALLTTDSYRIGGHEQLRIFGRILGVSVHAVRDGADLQLALNELKNKHIVLVDTIGMSQRDRAVADQIAMLCSAGRPVQRLLLLSATSHGDTLNEVVQAYESSPDKAPLSGCVLTKLDEATNLGGALDTVLRYKLPVYYVSTGQKVPENLYVATRRFLIRSAFCVPRDNSPFVPHEDDIPALLSALSARSNAQAHEVRFG
ncbi:flagellar biosynthesis protein FlhF [Paraburkholderia caballeronis]|uniref:Flagellar biosynthesis protein FlhF n=1 Tax=Paraburkholderia caballeronis TaxID=416943 RepID=A0A1H7SMB8_9BURK|nr:flagellar biosynthesis protein FlhF [Paraburkholderia caballeronis]PXW22383.1 flagellar biosynthesis protein FlhF [Paraburkholderia caballeronis]PXW96041.1 flagellar biosynthesis protein FlhF [Paraburkholderia caballeronis]RAJ92407.1 flagellar biosynthesis protein FlhF [Paraburkholderia caballeronis]TDV27959.1 flagellar biosynthesis protein FlhF [Paraburkholderia caballeronis]SEB50047.1 flagellar biosynthesis protein FlhF [Paraburkholderia caballeronis]